MPTAIVTGASRGLGFELTRALLLEGRRVVIDARGTRELEAAERERRDDVDAVDVLEHVDGVVGELRLRARPEHARVVDEQVELRRRLPSARVIVLTSFTDEAKLLPALQAGAAGYLLKNAQPQEIARAVRAAHAGDALLDPHVAARLLESIAEPAGEAPGEALTRREREVLGLIGRGFSNKRIALELGIAEKTVKTHVGHVLSKLGVSDRTQAALHAVRAGLVADGPR